MFVKVAICFAMLSALMGCINASDCPLICPALYAPVCATNGRIYQEFANPCLLEVSTCNLHVTLTTTHMDWCRTKDVGTISDLVMKKFKNLDMNKPECMKPCNKMYEPLCISNGKYRALASNQCMLDIFNCALGDNDHFRVLQADSC